MRFNLEDNGHCLTPFLSYGIAVLCFVVLATIQAKADPQSICHENHFGVEQCTEYDDDLDPDADNNEDDDEAPENCKEDRFGVCK